MEWGRCLIDSLYNVENTEALYKICNTILTPYYSAAGENFGGFHHLLDEIPLRNDIPVAAPQARNFFGDISIIKGFSK